MRIFRINPTLLAMLCGSLCGAAPVNPSLDEVHRALSAAPTVLTRFVQERHLSLFTDPLRTEGWLAFQKPGRVRWEITRPYQSILISDGSGVAQFEWMDEHWKKLDTGLAQAMQQVIEQIGGVIQGSYAAGKGDYAVSLAASTNGPVLTLTPRNDMMRKMIKSIEVHLAPDLKGTRRLVLRETNGDFTDIVFSDQVAGLELPPKSFDRIDPARLEELIQCGKKAKAQP
jgi:outer membrane lipoprotein carrier protein